jgi:hypothetical protein
LAGGREFNTVLYRDAQVQWTSGGWLGDEAAEMRETKYECGSGFNDVINVAFVHIGMLVLMTALRV